MEKNNEIEKERGGEGGGVREKGIEIKREIHSGRKGGSLGGMEGGRKGQREGEREKSIRR